MAICVRAFDGAVDYSAVVRIHNETMAGVSPLMSEEEVRFDDARRPGHCAHRCYMAEVDGEVVGWGEYSHSAGSFHPDKYYMGLCVLPSYQGRGVGGALYDRLEGDLVAAGAVCVRESANEAMGASCRFLVKRGFVEERRTWQSELDLDGFDGSAWGEVVERVRGQGIAICTFDELAGDPLRDRKYYELALAIGADIPRSEPMTPQGQEVIIGWLTGYPGFLPEGVFVAVDGDAYVGLSVLVRGHGDGVFRIWDTGVLRAYRRRGIATALKVHAAEAIRAMGGKRIITWNDSTNEGMLAINERLGYERRPAWIAMRKDYGGG